MAQNRVANVFKKLFSWAKKKTDDAQPETQEVLAEQAPDKAINETVESVDLKEPETTKTEQTSINVASSSYIETTDSLSSQESKKIEGYTDDTAENIAEKFTKEFTEEQQVEVEAGAEQEKKPKLFARLKERLQKTRQNFTKKIDRIFLGKREITPELLDELEEALVTADIGINTVESLLSAIKEEVSRKELRDSEALKARLKEKMLEILTRVDKTPFACEPAPFVILVVGVNGVGKTTSIAKLTHFLKDQGKTVLLGAADTFRAAAIEQLGVWAERLDVDVIKHKSGADPSAVAFDTVEAGVKRGVDVIIIDTAGRLHTKSNLMEELKKIRRTVGKKLTSAPHEVLLVLDATTGQNAVSQAKLFKDTAGVTGIILTKLDGTAKGGIVIAISHELDLPIRFIGIGESMEDLRPFDPPAFVDAIFEDT